ncbi:efflux RND transporter periplasmic adaptor subunit [Polaribacter porphyrae]|uniref:Efflux transporter periplasmic adaptor subunit n=1 Tax=Polaribacter porphyrae TaxID=1137780 RepID=A0A2S7WQI0_9FLAO|nr:efflux RND transporter periplasmic adaptor subunit [Polaribacter porphyrae]PQJ79878.1 efflux transporter periplasmic adaptor subunit [Polaribacter porphyrae]
MRNIYILLLGTLILSSCGDKKQQSLDAVIATQDLSQIRAKKDELNAKQTEISNQIKKLNDEIAKLDTNKKVPQVSTFSVKEENFNHYLELQGNVQTKKNVIISPEMNGILTAIYVKEGQSVRKGQALAKIDDNGLSNQLAQLKVQAELAKTTYERQKRVWDQKIGSEIQFLQAKANYEAQKNAVTQLEKTLAKTNITAPFSGVIDDIIIEQGNLVSPGMGVFRIVNLGNMYIETDVPESYITSVNKGKNVEVEFPILGKKMQSTIRQAGNFINPANRTFKIEVLVPNKDGNIKPNLTAKLKINDYSNESAILIPQSIISENAKGEQYVFVVKNINNKIGTAEKAFIKTGKTQGDVIEVLSGLSKGLEVVKEGARSVKDKQEVEILTSKI